MVFEVVPLAYAEVLLELDREAAVHDQRMTGYETGQVGAEEQYRVGDIDRPSDLTQGVLVFEKAEA